MPTEVKQEIELEIAYVLFIDIVGYSKLVTHEQRRLLELLNRIVREAEHFRMAEANGRHITVPTGDGMALVFYNTPEAPVECALEVGRGAKEHPELKLRMGMHSGPVSGVVDVSGRSNIAGAGINIAQRVMDCGDAGHVLISKHMAEDLEHYGHWKRHLHDLGECEVKHGARIAVVNLYTEDLGNPEMPQKFRQTRKGTPPVVREKKGRGWIIAAAVVFIAALIIGGVLLSRRSASVGTVATPASVIPEKSIAVMPFENLSEDKANAYFADGIQDEVLSMVAKIRDLKVISRTSTAKYKSKPDSLRQVGLELGVANLLEGSVQKAGDRVRVIVQLIDAGSDNHVWSETYDRELKDVFGVQSEIAQSIATALKAKLSASETHSLGESPTRDPEAYQAYLKAGYFQREATSRNGDPAILLPQALDLYSAAVTRDPSFALAWARMSYTHSWMYWFSVDDSPDHVRLAEEAAQRAISLDPQLGEAHLAAGYVAYWGKRDYATGMKEFEVARKLLPNNPDVSIAIGSVCRRRGDWATAIEEFKRAASLDPRDAQLSSESGYLLGFSRHYGEALQAMERALTIQPDHWDALCGSAMIALASHGDIAQANAFMARVPAGVDPQGQVRFVRYKLALRTRDFAKAVAVLDGAPDWILTDPAHSPVATAGLRGVALEAMGDTAAAHREFEAAIRLLEEKISAGPSEPSIHAALGRAYAGVDRKNDAVREGAKAIELRPVSQDAFDGTFYLHQFAEIQARVGNTDEALSAIRQLLDLSAGLMMSPALLRLDPAWDPIRNDPRFQKLCEEKAK